MIARMIQFMLIVAMVFIISGCATPQQRSYNYTRQAQPVQQYQSRSSECQRAQQDFASAQADYNSAKSSRDGSRAGSLVTGLASQQRSPAGLLMGLIAQSTRSDAGDAQAKMNYAEQRMYEARNRISAYCN